jgi:hypothetical protein
MTNNRRIPRMSAQGPKADVIWWASYVRSWPNPDIRRGSRQQTFRTQENARLV